VFIDFIFLLTFLMVTARVVSLHFPIHRVLITALSVLHQPRISDILQKLTVAQLVK